MKFSPGTRLGPYEIVAPLGAGGMGEVYRARDTKLDRDVALKTLPESFAHDVDRLTRFEREAKTLAALNHAHMRHATPLALGKGPFEKKCMRAMPARSRAGALREFADSDRSKSLLGRRPL